MKFLRRAGCLALRPGSVPLILISAFGINRAAVLIVKPALELFRLQLRKENHITDAFLIK